MLRGIFSLNPQMTTKKTSITKSFSSLTVCANATTYTPEMASTSLCVRGVGRSAHLRQASPPWPWKLLLCPGRCPMPGGSGQGRAGGLPAPTTVPGSRGPKISSSKAPIRHGVSRIWRMCAECVRLPQTLSYLSYSLPHCLGYDNPVYLFTVFQCP